MRCCELLMLGMLVLSGAGCLSSGADSSLAGKTSLLPEQPLDTAAVLIRADELRVGQVVEIWEASAADEVRVGDKGDIRATVTPGPVRRYTGTVARADAGEVELQPAAMLVRMASVSAVPVLGRVPYVSRMFRNTSIAEELQSLDQPKILARNQIVAVYDLSQVQSDVLKSLEPAQRIGVDFD